MRLALGSLAAATAMFLGAAAGALDTWALPVSALALLFAAVVAAVAMEARDLDSVEALMVHGDGLGVEDGQVEGPFLEAA